MGSNVEVGYSQFWWMSSSAGIIIPNGAEQQETMKQPTSEYQLIGDDFAKISRKPRDIMAI